MSEKKRSTWASRGTFILAAIGSAVGLGNAWRFPGLAAKHGGGTFLLVYLVAMFVMGIPLLMMEISIARKLHKGAGDSMRGVCKKMEFVGWSATANAFVIVTYYSVVFAWVLMMIFGALKFAGMTGDSEAASNVFATLTQTTWDVPTVLSDWRIPIPVLISLIIAWLLMYYCIRDGAQSVGKVVKYTVFLPIILLLVMAVKGCTMPGAGEGLARFFIPQLEAFSDPTLWVDAIGQVFYSLSICMAIMFAYGSYLEEDSNVAVDCTIIAVGDAAVSILSGIVMFSTMGGVGMLDNISASGIATAFIIYPQAIVNLTSIGWFNALFGIIFYLMLVTLAIDSAFSIVEGVSTALADKFHTDHKKMTRAICCVAAVISLLYATRAGLAWLDIVDNWTNQINLILIGVLECFAVGWCFNTDKVVKEINRNTNKYRMPATWFHISIKYVSPALLLGLFCWNMYNMYLVYNEKGCFYSYSIGAEVIAGWLISLLVFTSGIWIRLIVKHKEKKGFKETEVVWKDAK
ncbi:MAG: sodium-dependent transporter [Lachnospiraceae bacterium]|nr:sodium-dependent transporter [Lachnospiraceae bacterium]